MTEIKEMGDLCHVDDCGFIINESDNNKMSDPFREAVQSIKETYLSLIPKEIHSIYIRGSLPRGLGVEGVSDLDAIAITYSSPETLDLSGVEQAEQQINRRFAVVNGVEMAFYSLEDMKETERFSVIPFMLKTHSICIYGENLIDRLPNYQADQSLANEHIVKITSQINQAKSDLMGNEDIEDIEDCCIWIMKMIVRCGMAFVILEERTYTRDLYPAYRLFSKHYPDKEMEMRTALKYAIDPSFHTEELLGFLGTFGNWIINESDHWLDIHNPTRETHLPLKK